jgi:diaminopimelate epimerase
MSSGTGSCAATVAAILNGLTDRRVRVWTEAGTLEVAWPKGGEVSLTGPVERVMKGTYYYPTTK